MANNIIFTDGFDHYTSILDKWDGLIDGPGVNARLASIVAGSGRGGAGAAFFPSMAGGGDGSGDYSAITKNVGTQTTLYIGFALSWNPSLQTIDTEILRVMSGATCQVCLVITPSGSLYFGRGGGSGSGAPTAIGSNTATAFAANSFHYIEVQVTIHGSAGVATLKVDQVAVLTQTGLNTSQTGVASCDSVQFGCNFTTLGYSPACYFDDIYIDTLGFNGDVRINGQVPSGNGTTNNFTNVEASWVASTVTAVPTTIIDSNSNLQQAIAVTGDFKTGTVAPTWATSTGVNTTDNHVTWVCLGAVSQYKLVNESNPDGDSSYIKDSTVGDISRFTFPAITGSTIRTVMVWANAKKDDGGLRSIQASIKSGATVATSGTDVPLGGNYQYLPMQCPTDPNTGVAWTAAGVNAAEFGIKVTS
jgi:hypothetical protein